MEQCEWNWKIVKTIGEKPFKCGHCSSSFAGEGEKNLHVQTHTGTKF